MSQYQLDCKDDADSSRGDVGHQRRDPYSNVVIGAADIQSTLSDCQGWTVDGKYSEPQSSVAQSTTNQPTAATVQSKIELVDDTERQISTGLPTPPDNLPFRSALFAKSHFIHPHIIRPHIIRPHITYYPARTSMRKKRDSRRTVPTEYRRPGSTPPPQPPLDIDNDRTTLPGKPILVESVSSDGNLEEEGVDTDRDHSYPSLRNLNKPFLSSNFRPRTASPAHSKSKSPKARGKNKDFHIPDGALSPSQESPQSDSESSSGSEPGLLTRFERKGLLLERLMSYFFELFSSCRSPVPVMIAPGSGGAGCNETNEYSKSSDSTTNGTVWAGNVPDRSTGARSGGKRDHEEYDDDRDEDRPGKRVRLSNSRHAAPRRLACPYFKSDPEHPTLARSCSGPGWGTVHRLKEHLDRNHALPPSCVRCYAAFKTDTDRDAHMRSEGQCEIKERPPRMHGFDPSQRDQLKTRPKGYKKMSETQKWCHIYIILFPETAIADVPSPFYEFRSLRDPSHPIDPMVEYETFLRREMPNRVRQQLELLIEDALNPIEETLRGQIVDIVRDVQLELFRSFRGSIDATLPNDNLRQEFAVIETNSSAAEQIWDGEGGNDDTQELSISGPTETDMLHQSFLAQSDWEEQMQAYQPVPPLDFSSVDFDGELFDFSSLVNAPAPPDSTYGTMSMLRSETDKDQFLRTEGFPN